MSTIKVNRIENTATTDGGIDIDSNGKIGVGTASPSQLLEVRGSSNIMARFRDSTNGIIDLRTTGTTNSDPVQIDAQNRELSFAFNSTEAMRIDTSGNLGLGTSSPQAPLDIFTTTGAYFRGGSDNTARQLVIESSTTTNAGDTHTFRASSTTGAIAFANSLSSERLRIDSSGNVGIGVIPNTHNIGKALEIGAEGNVVWGEGAGNIHLISNAYYNGGYKYATSAPAGRYNIYQNTHSWSRAASGSADAAATFLESMRIDSSGRLLVGQTATPGGSGQYSKIFVAGYAGGSPGGASISIARDESVTSMSSGDGVGALQFTDQNGYMFASVNAHADATPGNNDFPGRLSFRTTPDGSNTAQERMRIDSSGKLLVGRTGPDGSGLIQAPASSTNASFGSATGVSSAMVHFEFRNPNGLVGYISTNGGSTTYSESSDYRLKENVVDITDGITRVKQLQPRRFNFIADADTTVDGFIAHEAQAIVPQAVTGTKDEVDDDGNPVMQGIDKSKLVPLLTAALQEAISKIETLETQHASLLARVTALEAA